MRRFAAILLLTVLTWACTKTDGFDKSEASSNVPRFEISGKTMFEYIPATCQLGFNREKKEFRLNSDTMSDFVVAKLSAIPSQKGQKLTADLEWTTERDTKTKRGAAFKVEKLEGDVCWLWDKSDKITLVVKFLD